MNTTRSSYGRRAGGYGKPEGLVVTGCIALDQTAFYKITYNVM